jgi:hypothetical protein
MMSEEGSGCTPTSASLASVLVDEGLDDFDDLVLLRTREASDLLEGTLGFADGAWAAIRERRDAEELLDGAAKDLCHLGQDVGAGGLIAVLPEGHVLLGFADELGELDLG